MIGGTAVKPVNVNEATGIPAAGSGVGAGPKGKIREIHSQRQEIPPGVPAITQCFAVEGISRANHLIDIPDNL